jgi:hypothetical protein
MQVYALLIALLAIVGVITALLIWATVRSRRRARLVTTAPLCKAEDLANGFAKMRGRIEAVDDEELLESPMTRTLCVYYKLQVEEFRRVSWWGYWRTVLTDVKEITASVVDSTGEAGVDLQLAKLLSMPAETVRGGGTFGGSAPSFEGRLQRRYGFSVKRFFFRKSMRYTETVIEEGLKVVVAGEVKCIGNGAPCFRNTGAFPVTVARSDSQLDSHYNGRSYVRLAAVIFVSPILLSMAIFCGLASAEGQRNRLNEQQANLPQPGEAGEDEPVDPAIDPKLVDLRTLNKARRIRAAKDLAKIPVDEDRRHEVAQALNPLLIDNDSGVRDAALEAVELWGTRKENEFYLGIVSRRRDRNAAAKAQRILNNLP